MQIVIGTKKVILSRALQTFIREQLATRLQRFAAAILAAEVELSDRNGRRGGGDKRCRIRVTLADRGRIVTDEIQANLRHAIRGAVDRVENAVHRRLRTPGLSA